MSDLRVDETTGDLAITNGQVALTHGVDATAQRLRQALRAYRGEWFLNLASGVPYYQDILVKTPNPELIEGVLKDAVLGVPGVIELTKFDLTYDAATRALALDLGVRSTEGDIDFSLALTE